MNKKHVVHSPGNIIIQKLKVVHVSGVENLYPEQPRLFNIHQPVLS